MAQIQKARSARTQVKIRRYKIQFLHALRPDWNTTRIANALEIRPRIVRDDLKVIQSANWRREALALSIALIAARRDEWAREAMALPLTEPAQPLQT